jgi:peptide/nickel transport system substrate-binding protein
MSHDPLEFPTTQAHRLTRRQALALGGGAALLLAGCGGSSTTGSKTTTTGQGQLGPYTPGGNKEVATVNWAIVADAILLDPIGVNDYQSVQPWFQAWDSILQLNADNSLSPMLATSWHQPDSVTYIYNIRSGVTFQDGSPMTAEDVAYSLERQVDPKNASAMLPFVSYVRSVSSNGNNQVIVNLKQPYAMWKYIPAIPAGLIVSKRNIEEILKSGRKPGTPEALPIGTGPYRLTSWKRGSSITMERYDGYWDKQAPLKVKTLVFQVVPDAGSISEGLLSGSLQGSFQLPGRAVQPLVGQLQVLKSPSVNVRLLGFNCAKAPFTDARVRQALSLAVNKKGLLAAAYANQGRLWNSPMQSVQWQFSKPIFQAGYSSLPNFMDLDLEKARSLIKDAGASGASASILCSSTEQQAQAVEVQAAGSAIGLKLSINQVTGDQLISALFPSSGKPTYDCVCWDWGSDTPDPEADLIIPFLYNGGSDFNNYNNPQVNSLLLQQNKMPDGDARAKVLNQVQSLIVQDQPWSILYWIDQLTVLSNSIGGIRVIPTWAYQHWAATLSGK